MNKEKGEPIYPIGHMCDYEGCIKAGKLLDTGRCIHLCENHKFWLPEMQRYFDYRYQQMDGCNEEMRQHNNRMNKAAISLLEEIKNYNNE